MIMKNINADDLLLLQASKLQ